MRLTPLPEFQSEVLLPGQDFDAVARLIRAGAKGLDLHEGHGRSVWCQEARGEFGAKKRGDAVMVFARAHRAEWLAPMQAMIGDLLTGAGIGALRWPSGRDAGKLPLNFSFAHFVSARPLCTDFLRVRLAAPDLHRLASTDSLHFRLVLPAPGPAPEWPQIAANGQTVWPSGAKAPHRPVYTVRHINPGPSDGPGWLDLDVFDHSGGRVAAWARSATAGAQIGLVGPSGGGIPLARRLILAGDETAYPAMARILESRPDALAEVFLLGAQADYPMPQTTGARIQHLPQGVDGLCARLRQQPPAPDAFLWIATEKSAIATIRTLVFDELAHDRALTHLAGYWSP